MVLEYARQHHNLKALCADGHQYSLVDVDDDLGKVDVHVLRDHGGEVAIASAERRLGFPQTQPPGSGMTSSPNVSSCRTLTHIYHRAKSTSSRRYQSEETTGAQSPPTNTMAPVLRFPKPRVCHPQSCASYRHQTNLSTALSRNTPPL